MTNLNFRTSFLSLSAILLLFAGCLRDSPPVPDNYQTYPLSITADEMPNGSFRLRWNAIKSADFIEYQVIRNIGDSVPYIPNNKVSLSSIGTNLEIIKRISDADSTFFIDEVTIPTTKTYLRIFAVLNNRNLSSRNVEIPVKTNIKEVGFTATDMLFVPEDKRLVMTSRTLGQMSVFHTDLNTLTTTQQFNVSLQQNSEISYGRFNNITEIYIPGFSTIVAKNFNNINTATSFSTSSGGMESIFFDKETNILLTIGSQNTRVNSFLRFSTGISGTGFTSFTTTKTQTGYILRSANLNQEVIAVSVTNGSADLIWLKYNAAGSQLIRSLKNLTTTLPITKRPFVVAPDNQCFITGNQGLIFNRNIALSDSLKTRTADTRYLDMVFSDDKTRLLALRNGANETKEKLIDVYKYPSFEFERSIFFRSNPTRLFQDGASLLLVGVSPNNLKNMMVERVAF